MIPIGRPINIPASNDELVYQTILRMGMTSHSFREVKYSRVAEYAYPIYKSTDLLNFRVFMGLPIPQ